MDLLLNTSEPGNTSQVDTVLENPSVNEIQVPKPNQAGFVTNTWKSNHIIMATFGRVVIGKIKFNESEAEYVFQDVPFCFHLPYIEKLLSLFVHMCASFTLGQSTEVESFDVEDLTILGEVKDHKGALIMKKENEVISSIFFFPEDMSHFFFCLKETIPVVVALNTLQAECFYFFVTAVDKIRKKMLVSEKSVLQKSSKHSKKKCQDLTTGLGELESMGRMLTVLKEHICGKDPISENYHVVKNVIDEVINSMPLKSSYDELLMRQFVVIHFRMFYVYYHLHFKSNKQ